MISKPILFSGAMVRAILEGRKTQTRRIVKPQPDNWMRPFPNEAPEPYWNVGGFRLRSDATNPLRPKHPVGSEMWVRETWCDGYPGTRDPWLYRATYEGGAEHKWRPSIFMPRAASRITLEVTEVRVQRLQDISERDAIAEGIERIGGAASVNPWRNYRIGQKGEMSQHASAPTRSYMTLWESINGPGSWDANPWVWVYSFERVREMPNAR